MKCHIIGQQALIIILTNETGFVRQENSLADKSRQGLQYGQNNTLSSSTVMDVKFQAEDTQQMANVSSAVQATL
jgi:hypothetical protein